MSELRTIIENAIKNISFLNEDNNEITYRTYAEEPYYSDINGSFINKPEGGLWGCRDDSWKNWCTDEGFACSSSYFDWVLQPNCKVFIIDSEEDFIHLLKNYSSEIDGNIGIDYLKLAKDYDAVELTPKGNNSLHYGIKTNDPEFQDPKYKRAFMYALNVWDVPSICVFYPSKSIKVVNEYHVEYDDEDYNSYDD